MRISEIKFSISGEVSAYAQGSPAVFIRLAGCNLHDRPCEYCDTTYALDPAHGTNQSIQDIVQKLDREINKDRVVIITGGEPLYQPYDVINLVTTLRQCGFYRIVVETNGTIPAKKVVPRNKGICVVADYKPPTSKNYSKMADEHFVDLEQGDVLKFPVETQEDFKEAIRTKHRLEKRGCNCTFAISPIFQNNNQMAGVAHDVIKNAPMYGFTVSIQLHKLIGVY